MKCIAINLVTCMFVVLYHFTMDMKCAGQLLKRVAIHAANTSNSVFERIKVWLHFIIISYVHHSSYMYLSLSRKKSLGQSV